MMKQRFLSFYQSKKTLFLTFACVVVAMLLLGIGISYGVSSQANKAEGPSTQSDSLTVQDKHSNENVSKSNDPKTRSWVFGDTRYGFDNTYKFENSESILSEGKTGDETLTINGTNGDSTASAIDKYYDTGASIRFYNKSDFNGDKECHTLKVENKNNKTIKKILVKLGRALISNPTQTLFISKSLGEAYLASATTGSELTYEFSDTDKYTGSLTVGIDAGAPNQHVRLQSVEVTFDSTPGPEPEDVTVTADLAGGKVTEDQKAALQAADWSIDENNNWTHTVESGTTEADAMAAWNDIFPTKEAGDPAYKAQGFKAWDPAPTSQVLSADKTFTATYDSAWKMLQDAVAGNPVAPGHESFFTIDDETTPGTRAIQLLDNIKCDNQQLGPINVPAQNNVIIDLNGKNIDRNRFDDQPIANGNVISNSGTLTITDSSEDKIGCITGGNNTTSGGGIYNNEGSLLTMTSGNISYNRATNGGAVYVDKSTFNFNGGYISYNSASTSGGGIYNHGKTTISGDANILENKANTGGGGVYGVRSSVDDFVHIIGEEGQSSKPSIEGNETMNFRGGGIMMNSCSLSLSNCNISGNSATSTKNGAGGAIEVSITSNETTFSMQSCEVNDNSAEVAGGALNISGIAGTTGEITITDCTFNGNSTVYSGSAINLGASKSVNITGCKFLDNSVSDSSDDGGAIACYSTALSIVNCSIMDNSSGAKAGGLCLMRNNYPLYISGDTIITGNKLDNDTDANVYLCDGSKLTVSDDLGEDAKLGITTATAPSNGPVQITSGGTPSKKIDSKYFVSDNSDYEVYTNEADGNVWLRIPEQPEEVVIGGTSYDYENDHYVIKGIDETAEGFDPNTVFESYITKEIAPDAPEGPVTAIADGAFQNKNIFNTVSFKDSVNINYIGANAFNGCTKMTDVYFGLCNITSAPTIDETAFAGSHPDNFAIHYRGTDTGLWQNRSNVKVPTTVKWYADIFKEDKDSATDPDSPDFSSFIRADISSHNKDRGLVRANINIKSSKTIDADINAMHEIVVGNHYFNVTGGSASDPVKINAADENGERFVRFVGHSISGKESNKANGTIFYISNKGILSLSGVEFGNATSQEGNEFLYTAMYNDGGSLTLDHVICTHNNATCTNNNLWGGACVYNTISNDGSSSRGKLNATQCVFQSNSAAGCAGGAINNLGDATLDDCELSSNSSMLGAGIYNSLQQNNTQPGQITLENTRIHDNNSSKLGGGVLVVNNAQTTIDGKNQIYDNSASQAADNLCLGYVNEADHTTLKFNLNAQSNDSNIHVKVLNPSYGLVICNNGATSATGFSCDNANYTIQFINGSLQLKADTAKTNMYDTANLANIYLSVPGATSNPWMED